MSPFRLTYTAVIIALLAAVPAVAQEGWSTTVTAGKSSESRHPTFGYGDYISPSGPIRFGSLSDTEFTADGERYTIRATYVQTHVDNGRIAFVVALSGPFSHDAWAVTVDGTAFVVEEAYIHDELPSFPGLHWLIWEAPDLNWTDGEQVSVGFGQAEANPSRGPE